MNNKLRKNREAVGLKQRELAEMSHTSQSTVSELERGVRKPWLKVANKLSMILKTPIDELFPEDFNPGGMQDGRK